MIRGYILQTAKDKEEDDPKDWKVSCRNIADNSSTIVSTVSGEGERGRLAEKEYRIDADLGDIWTDRITIKVSAT